MKVAVAAALASVCEIPYTSSANADPPSTTLVAAVVQDHTATIAVLDWVKYSLSPSQTRYLNENQMKAGEKIRAKIGLLGRLNIK